MNLYHGGGLDKLARTGDLRKQTAQSDNLSDAAARAMQGIRQAIVEAPRDEGLQAALSAFMRASAAYDSATDKARAAEQFGREIDEIVRERQFGRAVQSSLSKGMTPQDFWRR
jgi:hypothetical protein